MRAGRSACAIQGSLPVEVNSRTRNRGLFCICVHAAQHGARTAGCQPHTGALHAGILHCSSFLQFFCSLTQPTDQMRPPQHFPLLGVPLRPSHPAVRGYFGQKRNNFASPFLLSDTLPMHQRSPFGTTAVSQSALAKSFCHRKILASLVQANSHS